MPQNNPYSPPVAAVADDPSAAQTKPKGILVLQIFAILVALFVVAILGRDIWSVLEWRADQLPTIVADHWSWYAKRVAMLLASVSLVFLLQRRTRLGRWCGIAWLGFVMITVMFGPDPPDFSAVAWGQIFGYFLGMAVVEAPMALILYFAAFTKRARSYFSTAAPVPARS